MYIETHSHLYSEYYDDIDNEFEFAKKNNVCKIINCAVNKKSFDEIINICNKYENMYASIGVHPSDIENLSWIEKNIKNNKVVAIGEIGIDYKYGQDNKKEQLKIFKDQLNLAAKYDLPVIIHSRDAVEDVIGTLSNYNLKGVIHSFVGTLEQAKRFIGMGYLIGVNGLITFDKSDELRRIIKLIDLKYIVLETDSPFLTPIPYRGKKNRVGYIPFIAKEIAKIKGIDECKVRVQTTENVYRIFDKLI